MHAATPQKKKLIVFALALGISILIIYSNQPGCITKKNNNKKYADVDPLRRSKYCIELPES